jgi:hypothetical protein
MGNRMGAGEEEDLYAKWRVARSGERLLTRNELRGSLLDAGATCAVSLGSTGYRL